MADVFISYSQANNETANGLAQSLKAKGYDVWWDTSLLAGQRSDDVIRSELLKSKSVLVIWTAESIKSDYVRMEAGIGYAWNKLIPLCVADLQIGEIPAAFRQLETADVSDVDRIIDALEDKDILPPKRVAPRKLSKAEIMQTLGRKDPSLPAAVEGWLRRCRQEGLRIVVKRSIMVKAAIPSFGEVNFCTLYQDGTFHTNRIADSAERIGNPAIAAEYLTGVAGLIDGATVRRDGKPWTWRVDLFGELPPILSALPKSEEWVAFMKKAEEDFIKAAAATEQ